MKKACIGVQGKMKASLPLLVKKSSLRWKVDTEEEICYEERASVDSGGDKVRGPICSGKS